MPRTITLSTPVLLPHQHQSKTECQSITPRFTSLNSDQFGISFNACSRSPTARLFDSRPSASGFPTPLQPLPVSIPMMVPRFRSRCRGYARNPCSRRVSRDAVQVNSADGSNMAPKCSKFISNTLPSGDLRKTTCRMC